jgi:Ni/Co efflux regulator RcnB
VKMKKIAAAIVAMSMGFSAAVLADPSHGRHDKHGGPHHGKQKGNSHRGGPAKHFDDGGRDRRADMRGAGPDHGWHRGDRMPSQYRGRQYVVDDWRGHRLTAPPRGYHWVQAGGDYVLVAIATGIIASLILNQ